MFPSLRCRLCSQETSHPFFPCQGCQEIARYSPGQPCSSCALDLVGTDNPCPSCREENSALDDLVAVGSWTGPLREWFSSLKFGGDRRLAHWPALLLYNHWKRFFPGIPVIPVPPRPGKIRREGQDQVEVLAQEMAVLGVPIQHLLSRFSKKTQKTLNRSQRLSGEFLRFQLKKKVPLINSEWVLLDDIATTGATLTFCAQLLRKAGAKKIHGLILCRD